ncbi:cytochrome o ubiquinol oxidase subunit IV [Chromohalobacter israelensis]|uniref:Cytochrome bo(3) ubiquinol oxidase subunit 4 n=1 Tax=Chromohalobacter israelensis (strain ATCC BAA-138 / DSM 3043 / CIP 106854 / NCIMB 13768 / 1H11) TaxID=290398 RepID=Q1QYZ4_CHRI1|nr:cytochrome o ubiquinol oxidase subunit IV [Chromohalobacter salexigens]ABE58314.1 cytochrome bo3 quinol oxidase subunit 4 [Chromohalobacter salexigens DSM 3043]MDO0944388.1 cytochrome o ubiquinol oxidase subunit IV [Chromohalobacter salexigens]NWO55808.1 cytochrome o ubiquinol oxidase subunit IV [Chromohalobacter salexigens]PWW40069.1 cytochrome bo3 quinol oxidase subunit 4 [Chromohalobacter salexigens]
MSDAHTSHDGGNHGSVKSYVIGLILSIVLTIIPFGMVMSGGFETMTVVVTISIMAILQVLVQLIMFMHLDFKTEEGWNAGSFIFTALILVILVGGSLWIMQNLHANMMLGG